MAENPKTLTGDAEIDDFLQECLETMRSKGHDYRQGNDTDVLHNFRTVAETVGLPIEKAWYTYFYKHLSALITYIKEGGQSESEPIEGRVKDMIVYLLLFYKMIREQKSGVWSHVKEINERKELQGALDAVKQTGVGIESLPPGPVSIEPENGKIRVDIYRLRQMAGLEGVFFDPEILMRGGEITHELLKRDRERQFTDSGVEIKGAIASVASLPPDAQMVITRYLVDQAVAATEPLTAREMKHQDDIDRAKAWAEEEGYTKPPVLNYDGTKREA